MVTASARAIAALRARYELKEDQDVVLLFDYNAQEQVNDFLTAALAHVGYCSCYLLISIRARQTLLPSEISLTLLETAVA
ncbi:hypothetical protein V6N13_028163 [Hibiscus sabdariffa]|uniref:Uncharacterized protein n=1 Tax=Hibiscus sabdariffa TaxID=183260 RepID=A0ABR2DB71_9ROSI